MSEFLKQFPKPEASDDLTTEDFLDELDVWNNRKEGWLAALKWTLTQVRDEFTQRDIEQEIADVEAESQEKK